MKERIKDEVERHKKFNSDILGVKEKSVKVDDIDIRNYAKYLLKEGSVIEKRELLGNLRSRIMYKDKVLTLLAE